MTSSLVLRYVVENRKTAESAAFSCDDWLAAREQAVTLAVEQKATSEADNDYQGIRLCLEYSDGSDAAEVRQHEILTGERMSSEDILTALHGEAEILTRCGKEFDVMNGQMEDKTFRAVNHRYATLYYFTASASSE